ncbi:MAG: SulP family inorganic anion transporter [Akkermansiaceae bacterium]
MHRPFKSFARKMGQNTLRIISGNGLDWFPALKTLRRYNSSKLGWDLKAAINVALLALPQGMAYAAIAELPIYYGIICSAIAAIVAPFFSSSRHTILGPTNGTAFMVFSFFAAAGTMEKAPVEYMPLLVLMVGVLSVFGALFKVADLLQYVSRSVLVGYITGAALLILTNQFKHILGIASEMQTGESAKTFFELIHKMAGFHGDYLWQPLALAVPTLVVYLILQKKFKALPSFALCLFVSAIIGDVLRFYVPAFQHLETFQAFQLDSLSPSFPQVSYHEISMLLGVAFAIAFLASLENTVMAKSLASRSGERSDVNQDMLSVGMANIATSFMAAMPASGSLTRSALNYESNAKTRFASLFCGLFCLVGFYALVKLPIVENIPKASLAALVIGIAFSLIKWKNIRICLRSTSDDALVVITTFCATLLLPRLDYAVYIGVVLSITLFLRKASVPHLVEYEMNEEGDLLELDKKNQRQIPSISIVHVEGDLFFGAADLFRTQVQRAIADERLKVIILRMKNARHLDATSVLALQDLIKQTRRQGIHVLISGASKDVYSVLKKSGVLQTLQEGCDRSQGETNLFMNFQSNPNISTKDALLRAQDLVGTKEADIKIFYDKNQST